MMQTNGVCFVRMVNSETSLGIALMAFWTLLLPLGIMKALLALNFLKWELLTHRWP